jgi:hypothetical protein
MRSHNNAALEDHAYRCTTCKIVKPDENFHAGSQRCKLCHAAYRRSPEMRAKGRDVAARRFREARDLIERLRDVPCADCGRRFPTYCMEFDHIDPSTKRFNVAALTGGGITQRFLDEIAKCEVVCSTCHRIRTRERDGVKPFGGKGRPRKADGEW